MGIYLPADKDDPLALLGQAMVSAISCEPIEARLRQAVKDKTLTTHEDEQINQALAQGIISDREATLLAEMKDLRRRVIMVDDFSPDLQQVGNPQGEIPA